MQGLASQTGNRDAMIPVCVLIAIAVACGGGGVRYGLLNLVVQLAALFVLSVNQKAFSDFWKRSSLTLRALVLLSLALPLLHAVPLPPAIWTAFPGREAMQTSFELIGAKGAWASLSLDPTRTWVALSGLIAPLIVLSVGWSIAFERLVLTAWIIATLGLANVLAGVPQVLSNGSIGLLYPETPMPGVLFGTFANRNSTGLFLVSALSLTALLPSPIKHRNAWIIRILLCILLIVGVVLTRSRTALLLATIPMILGIVRAVVLYRTNPQNCAHPRSYRVPLFVATGAAVLLVSLGTAMSAGQTSRISDTLSRFEARTDARAYIWEDAGFSAKRYWPIGSGMGTFDEVFQVDESLENITERRAGRAHNDYLEVAIEAGLPGLMLVAGWIVFFGFTVLRLRGSPDRWIGLAGASVVFSIIFQSVVDYPLRNQAMTVIASFALLLLVRAATNRSPAEIEK